MNELIVLFIYIVVAILLALSFPLVIAYILRVTDKTGQFKKMNWKEIYLYCVPDFE